MKNEIDFEKPSLKLQSRVIRSGSQPSFQREHSEAIYETSSYVYRDCQEIEDIFSGKKEGNVYSRFTNPTVKAFEDKLAILENGEAAVGVSSGMSSLLVLFMSFLRAGDHVICSRSVFGSSVILLENFFKKFNIELTFVKLDDLSDWGNSVRCNTVLFFLETPSNPTMDIVDIRLLCSLAHQHNIQVAVDNTFCTPCGQQPLTMGADLTVQSTGKYIDGQGRCIGGAIVSNRNNIDQIRMFMRCAGPTMSPHNAWIFLKGLETLKLRMVQHSKNAGELAIWLENHPKIERVLYTGLNSHPNHDIALKQQLMHGGLISFYVKGGKKEAWKLIDGTRMLSLTTNFGDTKSTITHPSTTTHNKLSEEDRRAVDITQNLVRISTGLEDIADIVADVEYGLRAV